MTTLLTFLTGPSWHDLVWALIHTLYQAPLLALALALCLRRTDAQAPHRRYALAVACLATVLLLFLTTWACYAGATEWSLARQSPPPLTHTAAAPATDTLLAPPPAPAPAATPTPPTPNLPSPAPRVNYTAWLAAVWLAGASIALIRLLCRLGAAHRLTRLPSLPADHDLTRLTRRLAATLAIARPVRVILTHHVHVPAVAGMLRPAILLPAATLAAISPAYLEVILAHELAHIRRHDLLISLCQHLLEALLFFNPALWWISRQLRTEREACCDALAATATGDRIRVAQTLAETAALLQGHTPAAAAALAFNSTHKGALLERVKRLLFPDRHYPARIAWPTLLALVLTGLALLAALAYLAVTSGQFAARLLTPQEHIAQLQAIQTDFADNAPTNPQAEENKIRLVGQIRTADNSPLPTGLHLTAHVTSPSLGSSIDVPFDSQGRFDHPVSWGRVALRATADGYALAFVEGLRAEPGGIIDSIDLVLDKGFAATIRLVDPAGKPVTTDVLIKTAVQVSGWGAPGGESQLVSQGIVQLDHLIDKPLRCTIEASGYQYDEQTFELKPGQTATWTLQPAQVLKGLVVDKATNQPVPNAAIYLARCQGFGNEQIWDRRTNSSSVPLFGLTDEQGEITLGTLRDGCTYAFWIESPQHPLYLVRNITPRPTLRIEIPDPLIITGRIVGDLDLLKETRDGKVLWVSNPLRFDNHTYVTSWQVPVTVANDQASFRIDNLVPGHVTIKAGDQRREFELTESIDNLVIDLSPPETAQPATRQVLIRLLPPDGWPVPKTAALRTDYIDPAKPRGYAYRESELTNGQIQVDVTLPDTGPGRMLYRAINVPGYWFPKKTGIDVPPGPDPMTLDIPLQPAGAIAGRILQTDGQPAINFHVSMITIERATDLPSHRTDPQVQDDAGDGRFLIAGLPLGGTYRVSASDSSIDSQARVFSEPFTPSRTEPTREITLQFPKGRTLEAVLLDPDGQPAPGIEVSLHLSTPWSHGFGGGSRRTDSQGSTQWLHVNSDLPGKYALRIHPAANTIGKEVPVNFTAQPVRITLEKGLLTTGTVIEAATGRAIPNIPLSLRPHYSEKSIKYSREIETTTDHQGRFHLNNLEPGTYTINSDDVLHPAVEVIQENGHTRYRHHKTHTLQAGQQDITLPVQFRPGKTRPTVPLQPGAHSPERAK